MAIADVIRQLEREPEGSEALDGAVAQMIGWKRKFEYSVDQATGVTTRTVFWIAPEGFEEGKVPRFTTSIDGAALAAKIVSPDDTGGFSWSGGEYKAVVGEGPYCVASTPALALCIAALAFKAGMESS